MQQTSVVASAQRGPSSVTVLQQRSQTLGFTVKLLGQSDAPIIPQRVGNWWMEVYQPGMKIPSRARKRLESLLATGVKPKAVVLFHEIPQPGANTSSQTAQLLSAWIVWLQQEVPVLLDQALQRLQAWAPKAGRVAVQSGKVVLPVVGAAALATLYTTAAVAAVAVTDPCLVLITEDGYWVEVDRWDN